MFAVAFLAAVAAEPAPPPREALMVADVQTLWNEFESALSGGAKNYTVFEKYRRAFVIESVPLAGLLPRVPMFLGPYPGTCPDGYEDCPLIVVDTIGPDRCEHRLHFRESDRRALMRAQGKTVRVLARGVALGNGDMVLICELLAVK